MKNKALIVTKNNPIRITEPTVLFDLDGTAAVFRLMGQEYQDKDGLTRHFHMEDLYEEGYFLNLPEHENVCRAVKFLKSLGINVGALSSFLPDSKFAAGEKTEWGVEHLGSDVPVYLVPCGEKKADFILASSPVVLVDDYSKNLHEWQMHGPLFEGIKMRTDINGNYGSWKGPSVHFSMRAEEIAKQVQERLKEAVDRNMLLKPDRTREE